MSTALSFVPSAGGEVSPTSSALLDRAYLARQTYGARDLETEVLALFAKQVRRLIGDLYIDGTDVVLVAHTLLGSARGIGAFAMADAALAVETRAIAGKRDADLIRILAEVAEQTLTEIGAV